jgi:hypothetical protein
MQKIKLVFWLSYENLPYEAKQTIEYERDSATPEDLNKIFVELDTLLGYMPFTLHYMWEMYINDSRTPVPFWVQKFDDVHYGPNRFGEEEYHVTHSFCIKPFLPFTAGEVSLVEQERTDGYITCVRNETYPVSGKLNDPAYSLGEMWYNLKDFI